MKRIQWAGLITVLVALSGQIFGQNALEFTSINATPEKAIQLHWSGNSNEVYEIDYANALATNADGSTAWSKLYDDYPAQGTNSLWLDTGNYNLSPNIPHPKNSPMRFYRVQMTGTNTGPNPTITILSPTNGATVSSNLLVMIAVGSSQVLANVKLYVDGQEISPSANGTNFIINTCEWWNGVHTLFAVAKSLSHFEGLPADTGITYGHGVSPYVNVTFNNLISEVAFSQPYFEPSLGQTQEVSANFAANSDWTLQIEDVNDNTVRNASGSGISMMFDWDGTGDGETNLPDGVYTFLISAQTNGESSDFVSGSSLSSAGSLSENDDVTQLWALPEGSEDPVPLAFYPPGVETNGFTIFEASDSEVRALESPSTTATSRRLRTLGSGGSFNADFTGPSGQTTTAPTRPPSTPGKGTIGTFLVGYQTYFNYQYATFSTPAIPTGNPIVNKWVQLDAEANQTQAAQAESWGSIYENTDLANGFVSTMKSAHWKGSANPNITSTDVKSSSTGGNDYFNQANVGLLCVHCSFGTTAESDGVKRSYLRFWNPSSQSSSYARLDDCSFGSPGTNGLKWMAILSCSALNTADYNSLHSFGRLPINEDLHLLLSASTVVSSPPTFGSLWASKLLGDGTTSQPPETVEQSWFDAGNEAYIPETNHITITFRVAGWPDAFSDHLSDTGSSPSTGNVLDITKQDSTVFSNP